MDLKNSTVETALTTLEQQVDALTTLCERLVNANQVLIERCDQMQEQQRDWHRKNRQTRSAVEQVLTQLKPHIRVQ